MKDFIRSYTLFSLCGLNCGLCTMHIGGYCPGCGGGEGNQGCSIARCGKERVVEFCSDCSEFPCAKYDDIDQYDSFISHLHQKKDLQKLQRIGLDAYKAQLDEKIKILTVLLEQYNDGRRKTLYATAVNLLELESLRQIMNHLTTEATEETPIKEKADLAAKLMQSGADQQGISLKLRKKK